MSERVRINEVASAAGVSVTTVSHALSGRGKVSEDTRERVRRVALQLGYAPNRVASALRRRRTDIIGFVSDEVATAPFAGQIVLGAQDAATERGMTLMVVNSNRDEAVERRQVGVLLAQQVDALLYATMFHRVVVPPTIPTTMPMILVNGVARARDVPAVIPDEYQLGRSATAVLLESGHRQITELTISEPTLAAVGRSAGYRDEMVAAGLQSHVVRAAGGVANASAGREALTRALRERPDLTAVFCFNDQMALGVYQAASLRGLEIPGDISVMGVDDLPLIAEELLPGLSTVRLPHYEMGRWAVEEVVRRIEGEESTVDWPMLMSCPVVERDSIAAAS